MSFLGRVGEFGLIERIRRKTVLNKRVVVGIGDDAAVLPKDAHSYTLFTTDMLIEGRHFRLSQASAFEIGRKALAVNISDIAAMGGKPEAAVVAAGIPKKLNLNFVDELYRGLHSLARQFGVSIAGGDTNLSDKLVLSVALTGNVEKKNLVLRSGAKVGDTIFVTGPLGGSYPSKRHLNFIPKVKEARFLVEHFKINSMMDLSDGLGSDIFRLTRESGVGAVLRGGAIPVSKSAGTLKRALGDGEDFELLFTCSEQMAKKIKASRFLAYPIGEIVDKEHGISLLNSNGKKHALKETGFRHF